MRLTDEQLSEALSVSDEHPVVKAFMQILDETLHSEVAYGIQPNLTAEDRAYNCGRAAAVKDLLVSIQTIRGERS